MPTLGQRILLIGSAGSGKSTLARQLADITHLPLIHLDREYWQPGWVHVEKEAWRARVQELIEPEDWIMDGNYNGTMDIRMQRADTVIFLDYNRLVCLTGALKRWLTHLGTTRSDMGKGCPEKIDWEFICWIWHYQKRTKPQTLTILEAHPEVCLIHLRNRRQAKALLKRLMR